MVYLKNRWIIIYILIKRKQVFEYRVERRFEEWRIIEERAKLGRVNEWIEGGVETK